MKTTDNINFTLTGDTVRFINIDEPLKSTDLIRPLYEGWNTTYKDSKWRGPMWHKVEKDLSAWIGQSYEDYMKFCKLDHIQDEIVRLVHT